MKGVNHASIASSGGSIVADVIRNEVLFRPNIPAHFYSCWCNCYFRRHPWTDQGKGQCGLALFSGEIVSSSVERHRSAGDRRATYRAEVLYEFSAEGTTFNGDRVAYGDYGSKRPSYARRIVNRYPEGKSIRVYYMPGNPEECLLEPGLKLQVWFLPSLGLIFLIAGSLIAYFSGQRKRAGKQDSISTTDI